MLLRGRSTGVADRLEALQEVLSLSRDRLDPAVVAEAGQIAAKAGDRLRFGAAHTVVALAGATGSGKSSLFNALVGESLSQVGMRRPTTGVAHAAVWGRDDATSLLDWLEVPRRHVLGEPDTGGTPGLDGLVLLDLPDVDSIQHSNRLEAERLVERVDLLVWVLDPQKYADASLHERYLVPLAAHADIMLVVLNQVDRLSPEARTGCLDDLTALLKSENLSAATVMPASARTGDGIPALLALLARNVAAKQAAVRRLAADLSALAERLDDTCGGPADAGSNQSVSAADRRSLAGALGAAAGVDVVSEAVAGAYRLRARQATGWPVTAWTSRLRLDPARRLRLRDEPSDLVRTSLPGPSALQRAHVDNALRQISDRAASGLPQPWPQAIRRAATGSQDRMPDLLDKTVAGTDLGLGRRPHWWRAAGTVQWLLLATAVAGLAWLAALFVVAWLQLPEPPLPHWGRLPVPTLLLLLGLVGGFLLAQICGMFARTGARRRARQARRRLDERIGGLADDVVVGPVERELAARREFCAALGRMRG